MRFGTAIEKLVENYNYAVGKEWVQDKVAWALYHTWKEADDRNTEPTISKMEQVKDEPQADCGDFADRLAYERGVKHAWKVAQKVFDSTVTFYEAEDVAKQIDKDINVRSKDEPSDCTEALTLLWIKNMVTDEEFYRIDARLKVMPQTERSE